MMARSAPDARNSLIAATVAFALTACGSAVTANDAATDTTTADLGAPDVSSPDTSPVDTGVDTVPPVDVPEIPATPITAPMETWTWIPFPDAVCANGAATGIAVNLTNRSNHVFIFMNGGGACWEGLTCYSLMTAVHVTDGYTQDTFNAEFPPYEAALMFSRTDMRNPWRDASFVFIPYCTGDIHGGNAVVNLRWGSQVHETHFVGYENMHAYLRRLALTFPSADRVWLTGSSAGGFGAGINWDQTQAAFGSARVDVVDDSGPPFAPPAMRWSTLRDAWNLQLPAGCPTCRDNLSSLVDYYSTRYGSDHRYALLSYDHDGTISTYFGLTGDQFNTGLLGMETQFDGEPNAARMHYFVLPGTNHTMMGDPASAMSADGTTLISWLQQMVSDDPAWHDIHP